MKKYIQKFSSKEKLFRMTVYDIAFAGVFLGLMIAVKYFDMIMPKIGVAAWEIYITVGIVLTIMGTWLSSLFVLILAPFMWFFMGQTSFINPVTFFLDYSLPVFAIVLIKLARNKSDAMFLIVIVALIKFLSHSIGGYYYWGATWSESFAFNAPFTFITMAINLVMIYLTYDRLIKVKELYVNNAKNRY